MSYQYAYLIGDVLILLPIWATLFYFRKDFRKKILIMSVLFGICGPISELWYIKDYWHPTTFSGTPIGIEDFLFGFFIGGIASIIYEELFRKHIKLRIRKQVHYRLTISFIALLLLFLETIFILEYINSIYASICLFILVALLMTLYRNDLFLDSLVSGLLMTFIFGFMYFIFLNLFPDAINKWWMLKNISGIFVWKIPIEELLWAFGLGLVAGPAYEFFTGEVFEK